MRVFIVAPTPMMQAGLHALLTSNDIQIVGTSAVPDAFHEATTDIDAIVVADELQLEAVVRSLLRARLPWSYLRTTKNVCCPIYGDWSCAAGAWCRWMPRPHSYRQRS